MLIRQGFSMSNLGAPVKSVLEKLPALIDQATQNGLKVRGYVSAVMTCPFDGQTAPEHVMAVTKRLLSMGCYEISLGDTTGEGDPIRWEQLWRVMRDAGIPMSHIAVSGLPKAQHTT